MLLVGAVKRKLAVKTWRLDLFGTTVRNHIDTTLVLPLGACCLVIPVAGGYSSAAATTLNELN